LQPARIEYIVRGRASFENLQGRKLANRSVFRLNIEDVLIVDDEAKVLVGRRPFPQRPRRPNRGTVPIVVGTSLVEPGVRSTFLRIAIRSLTAYFQRRFFIE
jgi:hypothetical protein